MEFACGVKEDRFAAQSDDSFDKKSQRPAFATAGCSKNCTMSPKQVARRKRDHRIARVWKAGEAKPSFFWRCSWFDDLLDDKWMCRKNVVTDPGRKRYATERWAIG
jgi:hypothetical protein